MAENQIYGNFNLGTFEEIFGIPDTVDDTNIAVEGAGASCGTAVPLPVEPESRRFQQLNESDIRTLIGECNSKATERNTTWGVKLFKKWLEIRGRDINFEDLPASQLNEHLRQFYAEARNSDGKTYSKSSTVGLRAAIHRHLRNPPYERQINILNDKEFQSSNLVFLSMIKNLKIQGLDRSKHHAHISDGDLQKIRNSFNKDNPFSLLQKVWFDLTLGFAKRGHENQREYTKNSFSISVDDIGQKYIEQTVLFRTKNHRGDLSDNIETNKRIYETKNLHCPVKSFELYISKLSPSNETFFQYPKKNVELNDSTWFTNKPIGINTLKSLMKTICKNAGITKMYTNHCVRATAVNLLSNAGIESREICKLTGHKNEQSLHSYTKESSASQKHLYSNILQGNNNNPLALSIDSNLNNHNVNMNNCNITSTSTSSGTSSNNVQQSQYHQITTVTSNMMKEMFTFNNSTVNVNNNFSFCFQADK